MRRRDLIRRSALLLAALVMPATAAFAQSPVANDPAAIITAIYARAAAGQGNAGGDFLTMSKASKAKYFSKSLVALWTKADAKTLKGDGGPIGFDMVTNSQDPHLKSFAIASEAADSASATIAVTLTDYEGPRPKPADSVVRYQFVRDGGHWRIDEIRGAIDGTPWSLRAMLTEALK